MSNKFESKADLSSLQIKFPEFFLADGSADLSKELPPELWKLIPPPPELSSFSVIADGEGPFGASA
jgi:hypothetical protein